MDDADALDDAVLSQLFDEVPPEGTHAVVSKASEIHINEPQKEHLDVLAKYFGHKSFKPMQWEIISNIIHNKRDICAIMSTGYGKSLCFQYPSVVLEGITLVISPLIALMEDQVLALEVANIPACFLGTAQKRKKEVVEDIFNHKYTLIYLTPEMASHEYGNLLLQRMSRELPIVLIAIDEAHCISSWGHDFRGDYRKLGVFRDLFPQTPIIAVTATATTRVREDIIQSLRLRNPLRICSGFDRPNLYFEVRVKSWAGPYEDLVRTMVHDGTGYRYNGPTIIYCITRKDTEEISDLLSARGIKCLPYHAGLKMTDREAAHEQFVKDKILVIVATIAFGMGIDKPDIRNVIHYGCSKSIENYYQEVGRAGRDGLPAKCITFFSIEDFNIHQYLNERSSGKPGEKALRLDTMKKYLNTQECRRKFILNYFGEKTDPLKDIQQDCCDMCNKIIKERKDLHNKYEDVDENGNYDFTNFAQKLINVVSILGDGIATTVCILYLRGSKSPKIPKNKRDNPMYGCGKDYEQEWWNAIAKLLVRHQYLSEQMQFLTRKATAILSLTPKANSFVANNAKLLLPPPTSIHKFLKPRIAPQPLVSWLPTQPSTSTQVVHIVSKRSEIDEKTDLYKKLLEKRTELARHIDCMPYMIASEAALMTMAKFRPRSLEDMRQLNLDGFSEAKINKFGDKFLRVITGNTPQATVTKLKIRDLLVKHPLPNVTLAKTAEISFNMLQSGLTVGEIAMNRGVSADVITSHLISGIKNGLPIKISELNVTEECRDIVIKAYRKICTSGYSTCPVEQVKSFCPPEISSTQISIVLAYVQVRSHLEFLNLPFIEYEDFEFANVNLKDFVVADDVINDHQYCLPQEDKENQPRNVIDDSSYEPPKKKIDLASNNFEVELPIVVSPCRRYGTPSPTPVVSFDNNI